MTQSSLFSRKWLQRTGSDDSSPASDDITYSSRRRLSKPTEEVVEENCPSPSSFGGEHPHVMAAAGSGTKLAQEIHDEFLVCKICLDGYKNPKCLNCLHTFCQQCIDNHVNSEQTYKKYSDYREFTCPLCRKRTQLPVGGVKNLPDNFLVSSLTEVVGRQKPAKYPFCDICKMVSRKQREATAKCLDCAKLLCATCVQMHRETKVTSGHSVFDVEIEKDIECKEHQDEVVRFYCEPCDACICVLCTFNEHKDHEITQFGEAVVKYKESIGHLMGKCKERIVAFDTQVEVLSKCEEIVKTVEQKVHDTAIQFIQDIRNREKQLIEELQNLYGPTCFEHIERKKDLVTQVENLRSTCNLTDVILLGKDIELLLLKRDVEDKLNSLNTEDNKPLPSTINKVVEFVAGTADLGYLHDYDRPLLSKMRPRRANTVDVAEIRNNAAESGGGMVSGETQTDPEMTNLEVPSLKLTNDDDDDDSNDSDKDDDDNEDDSSGKSSDSESEDESKIEKKEFGMQTEPDEESSSSDDSEDEAVEKLEQGTMTEEVSTEEKGVNTTNQNAPSPERNIINSSLNDSTEELNDNSLAARRRRRRERAQTTYFGDSGSYVSGSDIGSRGIYGSKSRSIYSSHHSVDDVFGDSSHTVRGLPKYL